MPKRQYIKKVLLIGSGPIQIGQAAEFDFSGSQACKSLREEGIEVVLVNSNPATIMTDPEFADRTYIEPITPEAVEKIIAREIEEIKKMVPVAGSRESVAVPRESTANSSQIQPRSHEAQPRGKDCRSVRFGPAGSA